MFSYTIVALFAATALAVPSAPIERRQASSFCSTLTSRVSSASQSSEVTAYCSSLLAIPVVTTTATVTPAASTLTVPSSTSTSTLVVTTTVIVHPTTTITECINPFVTDNAKRRAVDAGILEARAVKKPSALLNYKGASLTSACNCLSIATSTTTISTKATRPPRSTITTGVATSTKYKTRTITSTDDQTQTEFAVSQPTQFKLIAGNAPSEVNGGRLGALRHTDTGYDDLPPWTNWNRDFAEGLSFTLYNPGWENSLLEEVGSEQYALQFANDDGFFVEDLVYFANGDNYPEGGTYLAATVNIQNDGTCVLGLRNLITEDNKPAICDEADSMGNWHMRVIGSGDDPGFRCYDFTPYVIPA